MVILSQNVEEMMLIADFCFYFIFCFAGCYDGGVYVLKRSDGATHWLFSTGDAVKSSPAVDPVWGLIYIGSHDQHLYALDIEVRALIYRLLIVNHVFYCTHIALFQQPPWKKEMGAEE